MPTFPNYQNNPAGAIPVYLAGGAMVIPTPPTPAPATILAGTTYSTGIIPTNGYQGFAASAKLTQAGVMTFQRYIDIAGTIPIGDAVTQAMTANVVATISWRDGLPAASWSLSVQNTSGSTGTLSNVNLLQVG
jgi:hypothetical protein